VLNAPLVDSEGHPTTLGALKGKVIVLSDVMTLCAEICPLGTASMLVSARQTAGTAMANDVEYVSLTIDPVRDDARHLHTYRRTFGSPSHWEVLGGSPAVVDAIWKRLGIWIHPTHNSRPYPRDWVTGQPLTTDLSHTDELIFIDGDQDFRYEVDGTGTVKSPKSIPHRLYRFMDALGHRNVKDPSAGDWSPAQVSQALRWVLGSTR
jgi:cytochrome oxidase Cu insertion factor (SCO1/SenC/PrrC family)